MRSWLFAIISFLLVATEARAHHIWIVPHVPTGAKAQAVFSDTLEPDRPALLEKIAHTKLWIRDHAGTESTLPWRKGDNAFLLDVPGKATRTVGGVCIYGIETHDHRLGREVDPYLLVYYPKMLLGKGAATAWDRLPLEIMSTPVKDSGICVQVLFKGKPVPNAEMVMFTPGTDTREEYKTDDKGTFIFDITTPGLYGLRTRHIEKSAGKHNGKSYEEIRHYATLVLSLGTELAEK